MSLNKRTLDREEETEIPEGMKRIVNEYWDPVSEEFVSQIEE